ncbi:MAG TPA: DUF1844 domain-containing protein [Patescibacteria group bacterium]|nr:DUF1844 domain-containing protein [Patescibacteria group bacterium]
MKKRHAYGIVIRMGKGKTYPEKKDIRTIAILLATQGMIRLGEIPDPLNGQATLDAAGAEFFIDLLIELQLKTSGNLLPDEVAFLSDVLENMQKIFLKKTRA